MPILWPMTLDDRLARAVVDVEGGIGDFAVLTADAKTGIGCLTIAKEAERLASVLQCLSDSARQKADRL